MNFKQTNKLLLKKIRRVPVAVKTILIIILFVSSAYIVLFLPEKHVQFSYSNATCIQQVIFLPSLNKLTDDSSRYTIKNYGIIKLGALQLISSRTCFSVKKQPLVGNTELSVSLFGGWFAKNTFILNVPQPPIVTIGPLTQPISTKNKITMSLSQADLIYNYRIKIDTKSVACYVKSLIINCDIVSLNLLQGKDYKLELIRMFNDQIVSTVATRNVKTIEATSVVGSSISQDQVVYDDPKAFTLKFDKEVTKGNVILDKIEGEKHTTIETTTTFADKQIIVTPKNSLDRNSSYEISIDQIEATDTSTLIAPYKLSFMLSDGPIVISENVGKSGLPLTQAMSFTFDQSLSVDQDITKFVSVSGVSATISRIDNKVIVSYVNAPLCADITVSVSPGLKSNYNIVQNNSWSFSTHTICYSVSTIGYSVEGRPIVAYTFGSGSQVVLYTGSIHGNELSAKYLMDSWINELEANAGNIPIDRKIVVIPSINPDGVAADRRNNSNNVDLNRNFPTDDWQSDIVSPSNQAIPNGGGASPLSEPESQAIAAFTAQLSPRLTMSFHSSAGYVIGNQAGDSANLASIYSQLSGYENMTGVSGAFSYPITGTYDDWMREKYGLTSVLVELSGNNDYEFYRNKNALWTMARL